MGDLKEGTPANLNGFDIISNALTGGDNDNKGDDIPFVDPKDVNLDDDDDAKGTPTDDDDKGDNDEPASTGDDDAVGDGDGEGGGDDTPPADEEGDSGDDFDPELEKEVAQFVSDRLAEELGLDFGEDGKFESVKEIVDALVEIAEKAGEPEYSSDEVKQIDEYIKAGGRLEDFFAVKQQTASLETIDLSNENNQRMIVSEKLKSMGYDDAKVKKALERYEDSGVLAEEAEDALELLKKDKAKQEEELLKAQKQQAELMQKQQQEFISNVQSTIESLDSVKGVPITDKEKKELFNYIFKVGPDGMTQFQKEFDEKALIESAYFRKMGDKFVTKATKKGSSDAYKTFHQRLQSSKKRHKSAQTHGEESFDAISKISSLLVG